MAGGGREEDGVSREPRDADSTPEAEVPRVLQAGNQPLPRTPQEQSAFSEILDILLEHAHIDFSHYRQTTVLRRVSRRMGLSKHDGFGEYRDFLRDHPEEQARLHDDLLLSFTEFFRDPPVFTALRDTVFPRLVEGRSARSPVRIWVPGCSTGEEVFSLAISLCEFFDSANTRVPFQPTIPLESAAPQPSTGDETSVGAELDRLRQELRVAKAHLQSVIEEKDVVNQDLWAANEEIQSTNEELQSVNAELDAATEELASSNEELLTLNDALKRNNLELIVAEEESRNTLAILSDSQEAAKIGTWWLNVPKMDLHWTTETYRIFGYALEVGSPSAEMVMQRVHPEDRELVSGQLREQQEEPAGAARFEYRLLLPDGAIRTVEQVGRPLRNEAGTLLRLIGTVQDITGRKQAVAALEERDEKLRAIFESSPNAITVVELGGTIVECNLAARDLHGFADRAAMIGTSALALIDEPDLLKASATMAETLQHGETRSTEYTLRRGDGSRFPAEISVSVLRNAAGEPLYLVGTTRDITERKQAEDSLKESEEKLRIAVRASAGSYFEHSVDLSSGFVSDEWARCFGFERSELPPLKDMMEWWGSRTHPEDLPAVIRAFSDFLEGRTQSYQAEYRVKHKSGGWVWLSATAGALRRDKDGRVQSLAGLGFDITERKKAAESLQQSEAKFKSYVESAPDGIFVADQFRRYVEVNEAACRLTGYSRGELVGMQLSTLIHPEDRGKGAQHFARVAREGRASGAMRIIRQDGATRHWVIEAVKLAEERLLGFVKDVTDNTLMAEQLRHAEKMQAVGQLAGGIAHDFNNQLAGILGYADILREEAENNSTLVQYADNIIMGVKRASDLTTQLLAFSRKGRYITARVDIHRIVFEVVDLLKHTIDKRISIQQELRASPPTVFGDPSQLQSAILNLALNARDAMPRGGTLILKTDVVELGDDFCRAQSGEVPPGSYLMVSVVDSGTGIEPRVRPRLFEPFFTTKEPGRGTGMGLAAVYGIVKSHSGCIVVGSELGRGSTFQLYFPLVSSTDDDERVEVERQQKAIEGALHVLLVEDEGSVRDTASRMLQRMGCTVSACANGVEAIDFYREKWQAIDLVVLDVIMPKMDGEETFVALRDINPEVIVLVSSGYSIDGKAQRIIQMGAKAFVQKPYRMGELSLKVAEALEAGGRRPR